MTDFQYITVEATAGIATIAVNRPDKLNALNAATIDELDTAFRAVSDDPAVLGVIVTGSGTKAFVAGADIGELSAMGPLDGIAVSRRGQAAFRFLETMRKPVVAAVGGPAIGVGTTMLLHFDLIFAAPGARFQLPFVPLGLLPEAASSLLLPMVAGYQRAAELLLLGQPFTADKALAAGIVTEIVPEAELLEYARTAALALAALPPASVRMTKELMKRALAPAVRERMQEELGLFGERLKSPEAKEALSAFMQKRKPDFSRFS